MASDSLSLARWWRGLCAGQVVSAASLDEMTDFDERPEYGLGIMDRRENTARTRGRSATWAPSMRIQARGAVLSEARHRRRGAGERASTTSTPSPATWCKPPAPDNISVRKSMITREDRDSALGRIRTCDTRFRKPALYLGL